MPAPDQQFRRIVERAGIENLRVHDLRRSAASWMALGGSSLLEIGKLLGHSQAETTMIYARLTADGPRAGLERATQAMLEAANGANHEGEEVTYGEENDDSLFAGAGDDILIWWT